MHACIVSSAIKWVRVTDTPFWPALEFLKSGMELILDRYSTNTVKAASTAKIAEADRRTYYLFGEERYFSADSKEPRFVVPFLAKSRPTFIPHLDQNCGVKRIKKTTFQRENFISHLHGNCDRFTIE